MIFKTKKFAFSKQLDQMDCGAACLKMICNFWGKDYSLQFLREKSGVTRQGVSFLGICDAAEDIGLKSLAIEISYDTMIDGAPLPCIAHWKQRHFVVVYKANAKYVWVADPAFGKIKYSREKFIDGWIYNSDKNEKDKEGYVIFFETTNDFYTNDSVDKRKSSGLSFIYPYLRLYKSSIRQILIGLFVSSTILLSFPVLTKLLVDRGIKFNDIKFIYLILMCQLSLFVSQTVLEVIRRWLLLHLSSRVNIAITSDFLIKMMKLPISFFDSKMLTDLIQRIEDQKQIENFTSNTSLNVLFSMFNFLLFGSLLIFYNVKLFLIFLAGSFVYFSWVFLFVKQRTMLSYIKRDESIENRSSILQLINGIQEIKLNNSEKRRRREWESVQTRIYDTSMKLLKLEQFQVIGGNSIIQLTSIVITFISAISVINNEITLGVMLATQYIIGQLTAPINNFVGFIQGAEEAKISIERISEILNTEQEDENNQESTAAQNTILAEVNDSIHLKNLSFKYGTSSTNFILKDINVDIPLGKVTAIVGTSGSGKTTLLKLLLKFYDPTQGSITIGPQELSTINSNQWRKHCGVVMQDGFIFADTILRNITESDEDHAIDKIKLLNAVKIANIEQLIERLPLGYQTNLSWGGINLSGGENQRVLIARSVYKNPDFIFFDEATSALDANNEKIIINNLQEFFDGRTVVVVAHRLSTVKNADKILVLEKGEVIEEGNHNDLVALKGGYFKLVKNQLELGS